MADQIKAEVCKICSGRGVKSTGQVCENCRGIGLIGKDRNAEYYLQDDGKGNLMIADIKSGSPQQITENTSGKPTKQSSVLKSLLLVLLIISYSGFIGVYLTWINDTKVFWLGTLIAVGLFFLFALYDNRLVNIIIKFLTRLIYSEPDDFLSELQVRRKKFQPN